MESISREASFYHYQLENIRIDLPYTVVGSTNSVYKINFQCTKLTWHVTKREKEYSGVTRKPLGI